MGSKSTKVLNVFISVGILFFIAVCAVAFLRDELLTKSALITILLLLQILLGVFIFETAIFLTKKAYQLFMGMLIGGWGILLYLMDYVLPYTIFQMWPVFLVFAGLFIFLAGIYKYHKFKFGYGIPSITLMCMGIWYMLFSFKIIKIPFTKVAGNIGPVFMLFVGVFLILFFFAQQKHSELIVQDDEVGEFEDEEIDNPLLGK